ncbi:site-2 protease family protein [Ureibacillus sp. Re31]|uniref:Site-2 protease family protein n=1 Tax=Ureibacillus galli TaxID=2762222 RepID=A0ABR8XE49_9BACL|nr:site-2 protease family protein [Ureibacillus galli]MBD8027486.1 site-2 protease family protein [Ureibacillus galli]
MGFITKPIGVTLIAAIIIGLFNFTNLADMANLIGINLVLLFFTLFIHELGHVLLGVGAGYRFNYLTVGPITIENTERIHMKWNDSWFLFGGVASCTPLSSDLTSIAKQHKRFVAGGPLFSIVTAIASFIVGKIFDIQFIIYFSILNLIIFIATILPYKGALKSDGRVLMELSRGGKETEQFLVSLLLLKEMNSPKHPMEWSEELIEQAKTLPPTVDNATVAYILFYYTILKEGYEKASELIEPFKQIPVTKENKFALYFIQHIQQIDFIVQKNDNEERIMQFHQFMNPMEPISFKRSEAILAILKGNQQEAVRKLSEVMKEIQKGKRLFGFFYAEEQLTNYLKKVMGLEEFVKV